MVRLANTLAMALCEQRYVYHILDVAIDVRYCTRCRATRDEIEALSPERHQYLIWYRIGDAHLVVRQGNLRSAKRLTERAFNWLANKRKRP